MLTELVPDQPDLAFGLCDLGVGFPELGYVSIRELKEVRTVLGHKVERDRFWEAKHTLSKYGKLADEVGFISHL